MEAKKTYKLRGTPDCPIAMWYINPNRKPSPISHHHPELEFVIMFEGKLEYRLEDTVLYMTAGDILVVAPEQSHGLISCSSDIKCRIFGIALNAIAMPPEHVFQREFVQPLQNNMLQLPGLLRPEHPAYEAVTAALTNISNCIMYKPNYKLYRYQTAISVCVAIAPWCIHVDKNIEDILSDNKTVREAMLYIHNKYDMPLDLKTIAERVHLHPNYLCALFKEHTGQTVMQYLVRKRVDAAIFLLQDKDLPIEVIAEKTGFSSSGLFFRHFRKITGMTPKAYRNQL